MMFVGLSNHVNSENAGCMYFHVPLKTQRLLVVGKSIHRSWYWWDRRGSYLDDDRTADTYIVLLSYNNDVRDTLDIRGRYSIGLTGGLHTNEMSHELGD